MRKLFKGINHIWVPYGVFFQVDNAMFDQVWSNAALGTAVYPPPDDALWDYRRAAHANAIAAVRAMLVERAVRAGYNRSP